jgi:hypothetical protein
MWNMIETVLLQSRIVVEAPSTCFDKLSMTPFYAFYYYI